MLAYDTGLSSAMLTSAHPSLLVIEQAQTDGRGKPELRGVANCCLLCCLDCSTRYVQYISHNAYSTCLTSTCLPPQHVARASPTIASLPHRCPSTFRPPSLPSPLCHHTSLRHWCDFAVYVAVHDFSFCEGAQQAFELTLRNIGQVAVLTAGERLLLTFAKVAVSATCTASTALLMAMQSDALVGAWSALDNANGALLLTFIVTFCVADAWMVVYDSAVEAVFLCYLVDQEENDGAVRPFYASATFQRYMERHKPTYRLPPSDPVSRSEGSEYGGNSSGSASPHTRDRDV